MFISSEHSGSSSTIVVLWNHPLYRCSPPTGSNLGFPIEAEDLARLSPLVFDHIDLLGRVFFSLPNSVRRGQLRPLGNPSEPTEETAI